MTELGGGVDKLEVDLLQGTTACLHQQRLERENKNQVFISQSLLNQLCLRKEKSSQYETGQLPQLIASL